MKLPGLAIFLSLVLDGSSLILPLTGYGLWHPYGLVGATAAGVATAGAIAGAAVIALPAVGVGGAAAVTSIYATKTLASLYDDGYFNGWGGHHPKDYNYRSPYKNSHGGGGWYRNHHHYYHYPPSTYKTWGWDQKPRSGSGTIPTSVITGGDKIFSHLLRL